MKKGDSRVYLRAMEASDYKTTFQWRNDDEIASMVGGQKFYVSIEKEKSWIEKVISDNSSVRLLIYITEGDRAIGMVTLSDLNYVNRTAHSHILIGDKSCWGKGYGTEALHQLLSYAFEELGLHRVEAMVLESNVGSVKMHKKCGYTEEGVKRDSVFKNGTYHNQVMLSILSSDFFGKLGDLKAIGGVK